MSEHEVFYKMIIAMLETMTLHVKIVMISIRKDQAKI